MILFTLSCYFSSKYIYLIYFSTSNIKKQSVVNIEKEDLSYEDKNDDLSCEDKNDDMDDSTKSTIEQNDVSDIPENMINVKEENIINVKEEDKINLKEHLKKDGAVKSYTKTEHIIEHKSSEKNKEDKDKIFRLIEEFLDRNPQCVEKIIKRYLSKSGIYNE